VLLTIGVEKIMSMIGRYIRIDEPTFKLLKKDKLDFFEYIENLKNDAVIDIDKSWHALHFVFTGNIWSTGKEPIEEPIQKIVFNRNELSETTDFGYGPATYLTLKEVTEINKQAANITKENLRQKFDKEQMKINEVYLADIDESENDFFEYVWENFDNLRAFLVKAEQSEQFVIFSLC
jgi:hypothetical protein